MKQTNRFGDTYVYKVAEKINNIFRNNHSLLSEIFIPFYTQLVLTALSLNVEITNEMVHDAWSLAMYEKNDIDFHPSMIPFKNLTKEVQDLDKPYVKKLNEVLDYFKGLKNLVEVSNVNE